MAQVRIAYVGGTNADQRTFETILRGDGTSVVRFLAPSETLVALNSDEIDLVVIDVMQPSHDVLAVMRTATAGDETGIPVLVASPADAQNRVQACLLHGAEDFLTTPYDLATPLVVTRRLDACVARRPQRVAARAATMAASNGPAPTVPIPVVDTRRDVTLAWENAQTVHRFIPREFLEMLERKTLADVQLGDHVERDMTVFFSDIRDFTSLSESLTPAENFSFLTSYLRNVTPIIRQRGGFVDKYLGDGVMALFPGDALNAVRAAVDMLKQLDRYNAGRTLAGYVPIKIGIGLHRGKLMLGTIGLEDQMQTTVIADAVNLASRIEGMTKTFGVDMLLSSSVVDGLPPDHTFRLRGLGAVKAKGKAISVEIFECYDNDPDDLIAFKDRTRTQFAAGMAEFRRGMFLTAGRIFARIAEMHRGDMVAAYFRDRCSLSVVRERHGPWDGAEQIEVK